MTTRVRVESECMRHHLPLKPGPDDLYYVKRCAHLGKRFVVEIRNSRTERGFVDYVEDLPDGELIIEADDFRKPEDSEERWQEMLAKMLADIPPEPER